MKFLLLNAQNTYNYGSMMMCENIINELNIRIDNNEFYIQYGTLENLNRLKDATNYQKIFIGPGGYSKPIFKKEILSKIENKVRRKVNKLFYFVKFDNTIVLGGDDFAETYAITNRLLNLKLNEIKELQDLNNKTNLFMLGQTVGPYTGERKELAKQVFKEIKIFTRDSVSNIYMKKELNVNAECSRDLAFLDLTLQKKYTNNHINILKSYNIEPDNYISVVGTGLMKHYCKDINVFCEKFIQIIKKLKKCYPHKKIVWLSHVVNGGDNVMLNKLNEYSNNYINDNLTVISKTILPIEARIILGYGYLTLTCRMHAAVSTFQMGKPAICLSYSSKYNGVIADGLDLKELVIDAKNDELWNDGILEIVNEKIEYINSNYDEIIIKINAKVKECKKITTNMLDQIAQDIINKSKEK